MEGFVEMRVPSFLHARTVRFGGHRSPLSAAFPSNRLFPFGFMLPGQKIRVWQLYDPKSSKSEKMSCMLCKFKYNFVPLLRIR